MTNFIEEFYYGNLDPQARSTKENKTVQKQMEILMLNEDFLTENLSGESKKKFLEFCNAWSVVTVVIRSIFEAQPSPIKTKPKLIGHRKNGKSSPTPIRQLSTVRFLSW